MKKILICDDSSFIRNIIRTTLSYNKNYALYEADNGKIAVKKYKEIQPDLVTMDICMPEMNGIEALEEIMSIDSNANVIMCSSLASEKNTALKKGAKDFISKPFTSDELLEIVKIFI